AEHYDVGDVSDVVVRIRTHPGARLGDRIGEAQKVEEMVLGRYGPEMDPRLKSFYLRKIGGKLLRLGAARDGRARLLQAIRADPCALEHMRARSVKVVLGVYWPIESGVPPARIEMLRREDLADLYFGEREPEQMTRFEEETGKRYHVIPNAANPRMHFPVEPVREYAYDIVYLGANLRKKRWFAENVIRPLRKAYRVGVFGPGWSLQDTLLRAGSKACKLAHIYPVAQVIDRIRTSIPPEAERQLYSSAKICLNFHEREDDGSQPHYIVNQRTFKIPACGGFQLCDSVSAVRKYFREDEVIVASLDRDEWREKIE